MVSYNNSSLPTTHYGNWSQKRWWYHPPNQAPHQPFLPLSLPPHLPHLPSPRWHHLKHSHALPSSLPLLVLLFPSPDPNPPIQSHFHLSQPQPHDPFQSTNSKSNPKPNTEPKPKPKSKLKIHSSPPKSATKMLNPDPNAQRPELQLPQKCKLHWLANEENLGYHELWQSGYQLGTWERCRSSRWILEEYSSAQMCALGYWRISDW